MLVLVGVCRHMQGCASICQPMLAYHSICQHFGQGLLLLPFRQFFFHSFLFFHSRGSDFVLRLDSLLLSTAGLFIFHSYPSFFHSYPSLFNLYSFFSILHWLPQGAAENCRESQRAVQSRREPQRATESCTESQRPSQPIQPSHLGPWELHFVS